MPLTRRTTAQRNAINAVASAIQALAELCDAIIDGNSGRADPAQDLADLDAQKLVVEAAIVANMGASYRAEVASLCASMIELAVAALDGELPDNMQLQGLTSRRTSASFVGEAAPLVSRSVCGR
jgi:hypothetical protein